MPSTIFIIQYFNSNLDDHHLKISFEIGLYLNIAVAVCTAFGESVPHGTLPVNIPMVEIGRDGTIEYSDELLYYRGDGLTNWGS